jgi:signal transduction histidine kinase/ligand-binding sensor domain-containing protein
VYTRTALLAAGLALGAGRAAALDPEKALTQYSHVVWQEKNGLPNDMVGAIHQTRDGYLWFGTLNGLARFDGVRFTREGPADSDALLHRIYALYEDRQGALWIGSRSGLTWLRAGRVEHYAMPESRRKSGVRTIVEDTRGRLWARTLTDLFVVRDGGLALVAPDVRAIGVRSDGTVWIVTHDGLGRVEGDRVVVTQPAPAVAGEARPFSVLAAVLEDDDGTVWFGAPWGLGRLTRDKAWTVFTSRDGLPATGVTALCRDRDGTLWVGTTGGLARVHGGRPVTAGRRHPLLESRILAVHEDREGSLWVGTDTDGVHQLRDGTFTPLTTQDGLSDDLAGPIRQTRDGAVWIGTSRGLNRLQGGRLETFTARDGLANESVYALAEDARGRLWVGTGQGVQYLDGARFRVFAASGLPARPGRVTALHTTRDGALWIGTDIDGLYRVENGTATALGRTSGDADDHVARIHERPDGSVWIATDQGIQVWDGGRLATYGTKDGLPSTQVRAFLESEGTLWIGTYGGGLARFRDGRFDALPARAGLPDAVIYEILDDGRGHLWMPSNRGVIRVSKQALDAGGPASFTLYGVGDGLKSSTCVGNFQPAGWHAKDGRLWFPTRRGVVWVDPARTERADARPSPLIERVLVDGQPQPPAGPVRAEPGRGDVTIDYTAPSFRNPAALRFRYRLDDFDSDWQDAGPRRTVHYTNVPPGRYTFRLSAVTPEGAAGPLEARLALQLEPHVYQTRWFYAACVATAALLAWALYQAKLRQVRSRFGLVLAERGRIAREMHDALDQGFTAISLQLDLCAKVADNGATPRDVLRQRLDLAKDLLEYARSEARRSISDLRSEALDQGDLVTALGKVAEQFRVGPDLKIDVSVEGRARTLPGAVENNLLRICQEAVTNAVRHGHAREVAIALAFAPAAVTLSVKDAGVGFDPQSVPSERDGHFGLMGMRERVKKLGGRLRLESGPGRGTEVRVEIPA